MRRSWPHLALAGLALAGLASGCSSPTFASATRDATHLAGEVPSGLGRRLVVDVSVASVGSRLDAGAPDAEAADRAVEHLPRSSLADLPLVLGAELEEQDLFDRVEPAGPTPGRAARLRVEVLAYESREAFDSRLIAWAWVVRHELAVQLVDARGAPVLSGRISGIAIDEVSDPDDLSDAAKDGLRLASLRDAATKLSRTLRRTAETRARAAESTLVKVRLAPGAGPVRVAVLGFDDEEQARRLRGPALTQQLEGALASLGAEVSVTRAEDVQQALDRSPPRAFASLGAGVEPIAVQLGSRLFVVGRVTASDGRVSAEAQVLDRKGRLAFAAVAAGADGLGAMRIVAADLARQIAAGIEGLPPPTPQDGG